MLFVIILHFFLEPFKNLGHPVSQNRKHKWLHNIIDIPCWDSYQVSDGWGEKVLSLWLKDSAGGFSERVASNAVTYSQEFLRIFAPDSTFATLAPGTIAITQDRSALVVAGVEYKSDYSAWRWQIKHYSGTNFASTRTIDESFGLATAVTGSCNRVEFANDGSFLVAVGDADIASDRYWVVKRYSGTDFGNVEVLDNSFGTPTATWGSARVVQIAPDNSSIFVGGVVTDDGFAHTKWVIKRYYGANFASVDIIGASSTRYGRQVKERGVFLSPPFIFF